MVKKLTGKKHSVLVDDLKIKGSGLYCFYPYDKLDDNNKGVFKIGLATTSFNRRLDQYHTYFPEGLYLVAFLENPPVKTIGTRQTTAYTKKAVYTKIESFIINHIIEHGGQQIYSTTRIKDMNEQNKGATEWIYTDVETIHKAFKSAHKEFNGKDYYYHLDEINQEATIKIKENPIFRGEIIFV